eukprot:CAMPEP_0184681106 /NCGR_PEP_ID=MMETSP0312-20130426/4062_1 /TAXON_ID=31354 /ORGANISM="Compsopogon coeruleus, Strain SAG 36.94" /LENGTH=146 /DNA_ID=CAMNT_0027131721 /DNA_START=240 /DNA_END=680 /DNA_ORIENTATION=+
MKWNLWPRTSSSLDCRLQWWLSLSPLRGVRGCSLPCGRWEQHPRNLTIYGPANDRRILMLMVDFVLDKSHIEEFKRCSSNREKTPILLVEAEFGQEACTGMCACSIGRTTTRWASSCDREVAPDPGASEHHGHNNFDRFPREEPGQ